MRAITCKMKMEKKLFRHAQNNTFSLSSYRSQLKSDSPYSKYGNYLKGGKKKLGLSKLQDITEVRRDFARYQQYLALGQPKKYAIYCPGRVFER